MKSLINVLLGLFAVLTLLSSPANSEQVHVAVTQIVEHPALDAVRKGVKDELLENGYVENKNLKWSYESAQGSPATAAQIAKKFAGESPDVIVAIATPSAQAAAASARNIPLVFSAVTDPVAAKLVSALDKPGKYITGMTDMSPIDQHMRLIKKVAPNTKRLGVIYNPGETNSVSLVSLVNQEAPKLGMTVVEAGATKTSDVQTATRSLIGKVDAIYVPTDNTVISALEAVIIEAKRNKLPLITGDTDSVKRGAIAAQGFNYYDIGRQTGAIVVRILNGESPQNIEVQGIERLELYVNPGAAKSMGVTLSKELIEAATEVINQ